MYKPGIQNFAINGMDVLVLQTIGFYRLISLSHTRAPDLSIART